VVFVEIGAAKVFIFEKTFLDVEWYRFFQKKFSFEKFQLGTPQGTAKPITWFKVIESGTPLYGSMHLDELNQTIAGRPGFANSERS